MTAFLSTIRIEYIPFQNCPWKCSLEEMNSTRNITFKCSLEEMNSTRNMGVKHYI